MKFDFSFFSEVARSLSNSQTVVFYVIYHYYCLNERYSFPTTVIANNCKLSNRQVIRVINDLERIGILKVVRKGFKETNEYIPVCNRKYLEVERNSNSFESDEPICKIDNMVQDEPICKIDNMVQDDQTCKIDNICKNDNIKPTQNRQIDNIESVDETKCQNRIQFNASKSQNQICKNDSLKMSKRQAIGDIVGDNIGDINKTKVTSTTVTTSGNNTKVTNTKVTPIEGKIVRSASMDASKDVYVRYHEVCRLIDDYVEAFEKRKGKSVANATSNVEGYSGLFEIVSHYDGRGLVGSDFESMKRRLKEAYNLMYEHFIVTCQMKTEERGKLKALYDEYEATFEESDKRDIEYELNS